MQLYKIDTLCFQALADLHQSAWSTQSQPFCTNVGVSCLHSLIAPRQINPKAVPVTALGPSLIPFF